MDHQLASQISPRAAISRVFPDLSDISAVPPMNALEILRETARILRTDLSTFMTILALLICPVSSALLSNFLIDQAIVTVLGRRLMLLAVTSGLPSTHFVKQICHHLAGKKVLATEFMGMARRIWRSLVSTYIWVCAAIVGCLAVFILLIVVVCNSLAALGYPPELIVYPALLTILAFSVAYAHTIIVCNLANVISVLEDGSGPNALLRSVRLVKGQTQAGLLIFLGSAIGFSFVEGLFEHRVKTLSYGDGSSRIWEWPLLVLMYSFVVLVDSMMSAVFYFTCRSSAMEALSGNVLAVQELEKLSS
ncbi:uncharacterized protein LOC110106555 isoform X2 [Dendrobium catenatum]|uniref:uncharacterized protein LOC110106555 isoform X2 n=1 Tax=Dendrobium catenatum TaxID=906689 RepID=UPI00109FE9A5|nr:uncharacterized protein LOC110106555 isoform X2 [Dendrobium catenatum]